MKRIARIMTACTVILFSAASCDKPEKETAGKWYHICIPKDKANAVVEMQLFNAFGKFEIC